MLTTRLLLLLLLLRLPWNGPQLPSGKEGPSAVGANGQVVEEEVADLPSSIAGIPTHALTMQQLADLEQEHALMDSLRIEAEQVRLLLLLPAGGWGAIAGGWRA